MVFRRTRMVAGLLIGYPLGLLMGLALHVLGWIEAERDAWREAKTASDGEPGREHPRSSWR